MTLDIPTLILEVILKPNIWTQHMGRHTWPNKSEGKTGDQGVDDQRKRVLYDSFLFFGYISSFIFIIMFSGIDDILQNIFHN